MKAIIDIGTNSVLMIVGRRDANGKANLAADEATITRLGEGTSVSGSLLPEAIERTLTVLSNYRTLAQRHGARIEAVATEGLRMASNREEFLARAQEVLGTPVHIISGDEEARLSYVSVARESPAVPLRVLDIGGGSTELVAGQGERIHSRKSHAVGSVRFTERFMTEDPPGPHAIENVRNAASEALACQPLERHPMLHAIAGTATTAAALLLQLTEYDREAVDGSKFTVEQVVALRDELAAEPLDQRSERPCLPRRRADVIVAGLTILEAALEHCGASTLVVRDLGLRYALL